jgi:hypothetical protein
MPSHAHAPPVPAERARHPALAQGLLLLLLLLLYCGYARFGGVASRRSRPRRAAPSKQGGPPGGRTRSRAAKQRAGGGGGRRGGRAGAVTPVRQHVGRGRAGGRWGGGSRARGGRRARTTAPRGWWWCGKQFPPPRVRRQRRLAGAQHIPELGGRILEPPPQRVDDGPGVSRRVRRAAGRRHNLRGRGGLGGAQPLQLRQRRVQGVDVPLHPGRHFRDLGGRVIKGGRPAGQGRQGRQPAGGCVDARPDGRRPARKLGLAARRGGRGGQVGGLRGDRGCGGWSGGGGGAAVGRRGGGGLWMEREREGKGREVEKKNARAIGSTVKKRAPARMRVRGLVRACPQG